jgi:hypothetical protein
MDKEGTYKSGFGGPLFHIDQDLPPNCGGLKGGGATKA